jgi:hypothetical protein
MTCATTEDKRRIALALAYLCRKHLFATIVNCPGCAARQHAYLQQLKELERTGGRTEKNQMKGGTYGTKEDEEERQDQTEGQMTRDQYLRWAKDRALAHVEQGEFWRAMNSFVSDLSKHPEIDDRTRQINRELGMSLLSYGFIRTKDDVRQWLEGFV